MGYNLYNNQRKKIYSVNDSSTETGSVRTQARAMLRTVPPCKFLMPLLATMLPAIPYESTWVGLTGTFNADAMPIMMAAVNSADAPCA